jgi:hypothetical protein
MLLLVEGFEGFGTATGVNVSSYIREKYNGDPGAFYLDDGAYGGYSIYSDTTGITRWMGLGFDTSSPTIYFGFAMKGVANTTVNMLYFWTGPTTRQAVYFTWTYNTGEITARTYGGSTLGTTSGAGITVGSGWHYVEIKAYCHTTNGTIQIVVDGASRLECSGNTSSLYGEAYYNNINVDVTSQLRLDDMYILDDTGTINNTFLGRQCVVGILPASDTSTEEWSPSSGTSHYDLIDENPTDGDTTYVADDTTGHRDLYGYSQFTQRSITGIQINTVCKTPDSATGIKINTMSGGTVYSGPSQSISSASYGTVKRIEEIDPDTSDFWTTEGLNAAKFGFEVG